MNASDSEWLSAGIRNHTHLFFRSTCHCLQLRFLHDLTRFSSLSYAWCAYCCAVARTSLAAARTLAIAARYATSLARTPFALAPQSLVVARFISLSLRLVAYALHIGTKRRDASRVGIILQSTFEEDTRVEDTRVEEDTQEDAESQSEKGSEDEDEASHWPSHCNTLGNNVLTEIYILRDKLNCEETVAEARSGNVVNAEWLGWWYPEHLACMSPTFLPCNKTSRAVVVGIDIIPFGLTWLSSRLPKTGYRVCSPRQEPGIMYARRPPRPRLNSGCKGSGFSSSCAGIHMPAWS